MKNAAKQNGSKFTDTSAQRSESIKRGLAALKQVPDNVDGVPSSEGTELTPDREAAVHAQLIEAIRDGHGALPSIYKARQFGQDHHAFASKDTRNLARAINERIVLEQEVKELRKGGRSLQTALNRAVRQNNMLQIELQEAVAVVAVPQAAAAAVPQPLSREQRLAHRKEYRRIWMNDNRHEKRRVYIQEHLLPQLRTAAASAGKLSPGEILQLVRDHIRQVS
jgi:hypothetical protein